MISRQFSNLLNDPGMADDQGVALLEDLVARYPYCQSGQLLLACNFYVKDDRQYANQLKKAAAYAGDRRVLKELVDRSKKEWIQPVRQEEIRQEEIRQEERFLHPGPVISIIETASPAYERMTQEELLEIVKKRLGEIKMEKMREHIFEETLEPVFDIPDPVPVKENPVLQATRASLIEKFIEDEPRISKPKAVFFSPVESAIRSNSDEEEIVSETLAQLYAQQGNIPKAIHIYEKLSLINQEKSRYFAAQIKNLSS